MGATNTTTYYNLSQFIGTDKPAWLQDYNGDMLKIDTAIHNAKIAADSAANAASAAQNDATTALGDISTINGTIGTMSTTLGTAVGNINTINSLIGNGTPTTTDQTIIGAINEINAETQDINTLLGANYVLSEYKSKTATADGVKTYGDIATELDTLLAEAMSEVNNGEYLIPINLTTTTLGIMNHAAMGTSIAHGGSIVCDFSYTGGSTNNFVFRKLRTGGTLVEYQIASSDGATSFTNRSAEVPTSGSTFEFRYYISKKLS